MQLKDVKEPGLYWGKSSNYKWHNMIVCVEGDAPFFTVYGWYWFDNELKEKITDFTMEIGDKIEQPEDKI
jgi:hypothetical protein